MHVQLKNIENRPNCHNLGAVNTHGEFMCPNRSRVEETRNTTEPAQSRISARNAVLMRTILESESRYIPERRNTSNGLNQ